MTKHTALKKGALLTIIIVFSFVIGFFWTDFTSKPAKNIILFIGDGMGTTQLTAAMTMSKKTLNIEQFIHTGFTKTSAADKYVTDSAASGTAIATGEKTNNKMIGVAPDSTNLLSIMELAKQNGLSTGLISTVAITHATPASFVAHNANRDNYEDIAKDFMNNTIDVFIGGGLNHFKSRKDSIDLTVQLEHDGYDVVYTIDEMKKSTTLKLVGLLDTVHLPSVSAGRGTMLEDATRKAIEVLGKNKKGFMLMVEGSMIDFGGHANDIDFDISELIDMDNAIGIALEFARINKNTTIVITADHETGGLSLIDGNAEDHTVKAVFSSKDHTAVMVPVFSYGPGAERFAGIHENTFFFNEFIDLLKLKKIE